MYNNELQVKTEAFSQNVACFQTRMRTHTLLTLSFVRHTDLSPRWSSFWFPLCVSLRLSTTHILHKIWGNGSSLSVNGSFSNYHNVQPGTTRSALDDDKHTRHIKSTGNQSVSIRLCITHVVLCVFVCVSVQHTGLLVSCLRCDLKVVGLNPTRVDIRHTKLCIPLMHLHH